MSFYPNLFQHNDVLFVYSKLTGEEKCKYSEDAINLDSVASAYACNEKAHISESAFNLSFEKLLKIVEGR